MPVICIKSLPVEKPAYIPELLKNLNSRLAEVLGCNERHVWSYWQDIKPNYYAVGAESSEKTHINTFSPIVEILGFEGKPESVIENMLRTAAEVISAGTGIDPANIFIAYNEAKSGRVFDGGDIVRKK